MAREHDYSPASLAFDFDISARADHRPDVRAAGVGLPGLDHVAQIDLVLHAAILLPIITGSIIYAFACFFNDNCMQIEKRRNVNVIEMVIGICYNHTGIFINP